MIVWACIKLSDRDFAICQTGIINLYHCVFKTLFESCPIEIINLYCCVFETLFKRGFAICQTGILWLFINLYDCVFETLFKRGFAICPIEIMILLQILSTSIVWFLKPSLKGVLRIVKQEYYDYSSTSKGP